MRKQEESTYQKERFLYKIAVANNIDYNPRIFDAKRIQELKDKVAAILPPTL